MRSKERKKANTSNILAKSYPPKKMELKIEITSKETIKPSSPTPNHQRTYNLNVIDQVFLCSENIHVPVILFYDTISQNQTETSFLLKNSLQETLTHFYPLAGRVKGYSYIDCNDAGATYIETLVAENMKEVLKQPKFEKLRQLLPINPYENCIHKLSVPELLLIQVNHFSCGGVAIGVCISHTIADATALGTFVKTWAAIACGNVCDVNGIVTDTTSIFPPVDDSETFYFSSLNEPIVEDQLLGIENNRFEFDGAKIVALRTKIGRLSMPGNSDLPTRFEALSALIMGVLMSIIDEKRSDHVALVPTNLRKRMNPPLPPQCIGNVIRGTRVVSLSNEHGIDYNNLARKIRESLTSTNDENVKKFHAAGGILNFAKVAYAEMEKREVSESAREIKAVFSSWCNSPFYEANFGWGKPVWVATALNQNRTAYFLDSRDGEGIEVWLGLHPEVMSKFEQNPDIIEFASFVPTK